MENLVKSDIGCPDTTDKDPRMGHLLAHQQESSPKVVLLGFPSDEGVKRNGGREGAAEAPDEIRKELYKMTPDAEETE
ncbi:MAG TPA: hypothetical protein VK112_13855, partial [Fodinibius sp.]|nr:hypothetical protein [Fodinibius sp.]